MQSLTTNIANFNRSQARGLSGCFIAWSFVAIAGLWVSSFYGLEVLWVVTAIIAMALAWKFHYRAFLLLVPLLFLEHDVFSLELPFGRLRAYHLLIALLAARLVFDFLKGTLKWRRTALDLPFLIFLGINAVAIIWSPDQAVALKIFGLECLLALLYWVVVNYVRSAEQVQQILRWFLGSAAVVALIGILQIIAVWLASAFDVALWQGPIIHSDILPFGRPYGTFVEPDWYGALAMVALLVSVAFVLSKKYAQQQLKYLGLAVLFAVALILSVVRGAWLGAGIGLVVLLIINRRRQLLNARLLLPVSIGLVLGMVGFAIFSPEVVGAVVSRLFSLGSLQTIINEPRFLVVQEGLGIWLSSPLSIWLGQGPGTFNVLGSIPFVPPIQQIVQGLVPFQTNAVVNILLDTGLAGLIVIFWIILRLVNTVRAGLRNLSDDLVVTLMGLTAALAGLVITYQVTTGMWLALSWFVLGLTIACALIPKNKYNYAT